MIKDILRKLLDTSEKDVKNLLPLAESINSFEPAMEKLTDEELKAKTAEFKERLVQGETLEKLLPEAFAVVREASLRTLGMRQFDVQMIGGAVLHQGRIAEMRTGEGKTLVAAAPLYLNSLVGKGSHLVTANDYLARRDATWMGPIYHFLGLSVGIIQGQSLDSDELGGNYIYKPGTPNEDPRYTNLVPCSRREAYMQDITYGTNHEFGFDYLRDNMAFQKEGLSMRELSYAIIDEVDSILIDEARTPHIISGPSNDDVSLYKEINEVAIQLTGGGKDEINNPEVHYTIDKKSHQATLTESGMDLVEEFLGIENIASDPKLFHYINAAIKAHGVFKKDTDYVVRNNEVVIVDENTGRMMFGRRYSDGLHQALEAKEGVPVQRESQTVAVITFQNLFRMYKKLGGMTGTAKTEEDEFRKIYGLDVVSIPTHRPSKRTDQNDTVYKTQEAKFRGISKELLRLYSKQQPVLVGTRSIEMSETVSDRLKSEMLQKTVMIDRLAELKEDKTVSKEAKKLIDELIAIPFDDISKQAMSIVADKAGIPTDPLNEDHWTWFSKKYNLSVENKTYFEESLRHGIPHNVLNAKYHEREALIISEAGRKGAITIATNMAGRGVDILLGGRVSDEVIEQDRVKEESMEHSWNDEYTDTFKHFRRGGLERAAPPLPIDDQERAGLSEIVREVGGLYILGTERHESRRIDNQLRGRAGRQGDPGESRFFVSLEDQLWKIFNAKLLESPMLKQWPDMEEVKAGMLTNMIKKTQERIENHFFESRKHVLEYDDVLNSQREHIYGMRREYLLGQSAREDLYDGLQEVIADCIGRSWQIDESGQKFLDSESLFENLNDIFPLVDKASLEEIEAHEPGGPLEEFLFAQAKSAYEERVEMFGDEAPEVERHIMLQAINDRWMEHLQIIDYIREGIQLRAYGQVDPLTAYKRETFDLFNTTLRQIRELTVRYMFRAMPQAQHNPEAIDATNILLDEVEQNSGSVMALPDGEMGQWPEDTDPKKVGRNEPCPCGSGRKFKSCHYPFFREQGLI